MVSRRMWEAKPAGLAAAGLAAFLLAGIPFDDAAAAERERLLTVGAAETVKIYPGKAHPGGIAFKARIDTGAATTSINARKIVPFRRGGRRWVRFEIVDKRGRAVAMERAVVRVVRIIRFDGTRPRRYVVRIGICLGDVYKDAQVNLQDRRYRKFPVLIGRRLMAGAVLVDPGREYMAPPRCPGAR